MGGIRGGSVVIVVRRRRRRAWHLNVTPSRVGSQPTEEIGSVAYRGWRGGGGVEAYLIAITRDKYSVLLY